MFIYKIVNKTNGKLYIGKTEKTLALRWASHVRHYSNKVNRRLYDAMNKYGIDNFKIELVEHVADVKILNEREKYWISYYKTMDKNFGYNMTEGGDGGRLSPEMHAMIGKKVSIANKGRIASEETRKKISDAHKGMSPSQETKDKISQTNKRLGISPPKTSLPGELHPMWGKTHTQEAKEKLSLARMGKKYEEVMPLETAARIKQMRKEKWSGVDNPNYKFFDFDLLIQLIINNPGICNKELASLLGSSRTTLHAKVKEKYGMTISEFKLSIVNGFLK